MKLPKSFNELTVEQYQRVHVILNSDLDRLDKYSECLSFLSGTSLEEIDQLTPARVKELFQSISFLDKPEVNESYATRIRVGTRFYMPIIHNSEFSTAALVALKHFDKDVIKNLHECLACVYSPMGWDLKPKPYNGKNHERIAKDMLKVKMGDVYGFLALKKKVYVKSSPTIQTYLTRATQKIQEILKEIETEFKDLSNTGAGYM